MDCTRFALPRLAATAAALVAALVAAAPATAAPSPTGPDAGKQFTEGDAITFTWTGGLEGDAAARDQSFFRVEIAPDGSPWSSLANYGITASGEEVRSLALGVPDEGTYKWRVCSWGVADASLDLSLQQLSCSAATTLVSVAASDVPGASPVHETQQVRHVPGGTIVRTEKRYLPDEPQPEPTVVTKVRPAKQQPAEPAPPVARALTASFQGLRGEYDPVAYGEGTTSLGLNDASMASRSTIITGLDGLMKALGSHVPLLALPYWSLLLFLLALPLTWLWRRSLLRMFEWSPARHRDGDETGAELGPIPAAD